MIHLGFEIGTGESVDIPQHHLVVSGLTRLSGKTTCLEALLSRSDFRGLVFRTKRGELGFRDAHRIPPFLVARADWQYVSAILEATLRERLKFERYWIMKVTKGANDLKDVQKRVREALEQEKLRDLDRAVFTTLDEYLSLVVPQIEQTKFSTKLVLEPGLNLMDLEHLSAEVQQLVIRSTLEQVQKTETQVVVVVPECPDFIPEGRNTPVKQAALDLVRKGAVVGNYLWMDGQTVTGIEKSIIKQADTWILGRQREVNEVKRTLDQLPVAKATKPKVEEIMTLGIGEFYACFGDRVVKTYVQPAWVDDDTARAIALGTTSKPQRPEDKPEEEIDMERLEAVERELVDVKSSLKELETRVQKAANGTVAGNTTIMLAPLPVLKHRYQRETVDRLLAMVTNLPIQEKRALEWLVAVQKTVRLKDVAQGLGVPVSGGSYTALGDRVGTLVRLGLVKRDSHGIQSIVEEKVSGEMASYDATREDCDATVKALIGALVVEDGKS